MTDLSAAIRTSLGHALSGHYAHADVRQAIEAVALAPAGARHGGAPHSIRQIVEHMIFWQEFFLERLEGTPVPEPAEDRWDWPAEPADEAEWSATVARFVAGLERAARLVEQPGLAELLAGSSATTRLDALRTIASHNSYHVGQVMLLRKMAG